MLPNAVLVLESVRMRAGNPEKFMAFEVIVGLIMLTQSGVTVFTFAGLANRLAIRSRGWLAIASVEWVELGSAPSSLGLPSKSDSAIQGRHELPGFAGSFLASSDVFMVFDLICLVAVFPKAYRSP